MRPFLYFTTAVLLFFPLEVFAYRVPERDDWRTYTLSLINRSRMEQNLLPLGLDAELTDLAQAHAEDTAVHYDDSSRESRRSSYLMHRSSDRRELGDRVRGRNIRGANRFGENVGLRYSRPFTDSHAAIEEAITFLHTSMMAEVPPDDGHRQTILGDYTHVGIGLELHREAGSETNTLFLVADFARFTDGRAVVIPELGPKPQTVLTKKIPVTRRPPSSPALRKRQRVRRGTLQGRRLQRDRFIPRERRPRQTSR